jgi:Ras-related protein Rab-11A
LSRSHFLYVAENRMDHEYDFLYKVILLGDPGVGKTSYARSLDNKDVSLEHQVTIGVDFLSYDVKLSNDKRIRNHIWDTAGQERYANIIRNYYSHAIGIILCFDVTMKSSLDNCHRWIDHYFNAVRARFGVETSVKIILLGLKTDLRSRIDFAGRIVKNKDIDDFLNTYQCNKSIEMVYMEACPMSGTGVSEAMVMLDNLIYTTWPEKNDMCYPTGITLATSEKKIKKCCI